LHIWWWCIQAGRGENCDNITSLTNFFMLRSIKINIEARTFWSHFWPTLLCCTLQCWIICWWHFCRDSNLCISFSVRQQTNIHDTRCIWEVAACNKEWKKLKVCNNFYAWLCRLRLMTCDTSHVFLLAPCRNIMYWWPSEAMKINLRINFRFPFAWVFCVSMAINQF
jgi:hypothetical protein